MRPTRSVALASLLLAACSGAASTPSPVAGPRTRAERSGFAETSRYADVVAFLDTLGATGRVHLDTLGTSSEGRAIPLVVASRPLVRGAAEARATGKPVVWVQGNIHAGEVEGKEALQALLRDLALAPRANVLDSIVLVAVPIYNADGNERVGPQARQRGEQNGPELVGQRANGQGLDLNRDYVKADAPETRASLAALAAWDPAVFVDLHTTNGSYHGYALTYSPSLHPAAALGEWTRQSLLPELRRRVRARHRLETFDYGNFSLQYGADVTTDTVKQGWWTYDHRPRFGTNYHGLRSRVSVLAEAYSHDPFARRVAAMEAFVRELLSLVAERGPELRTLARAADARGGLAPSSEGVALAATITRSPHAAPVIAEDLLADPDSVPDEPGVPRGIRRSGRFRTQVMPVYDRFEPTVVRALPAAWALAAGQDSAVARLRAHGIAVEPLASAWTGTVAPDLVDSVRVAERPFQGRREVRTFLAGGRTPPAPRTLPAGTWIVRADQPLATLAAVLLEAGSDDGLATWGVIAVTPGEYPVLRLPVVPGR